MQGAAATVPHCDSSVKAGQFHASEQMSLTSEKASPCGYDSLFEMVAALDGKAMSLPEYLTWVNNSHTGSTIRLTRSSGQSSSIGMRELLPCTASVRVLYY